MSDEWWENETEVDASPGLPAKIMPPELDEVDKYRLPKSISASWVQAQLTKAEWAHIRSTQKSLTLNPHVITSMCMDAKKGLSKRSIMARHGLAVTTWHQWERKAAEGVQPYALWYQCMMYSISTVEEELIDNIKLAGMADWKASKWLLEQINKEEYAPTPKGQVVNIAGDVNTETSVNYVNDTEAMQIARIMQEIGGLEVLDAEVVEDGNED